MLKKKKATGTSKGKTKGKERTKPAAGTVSLDDEDAIESGLFASGPAVVKESIFAMYDYGGNARPTPVWLLTYGRDGEEDYEQPYSLGKGWKVIADGKKIKALAGQTGLPKSCNAIRHLVSPLKKALAKTDFEIDLASGDPSVLDGLEVMVRRVDQEVRDIKGSKAKKRDDDQPRTILEIEKVVGTDGDTTASTVKKKKKNKREDEDEDDQDQDDDSETDDDDEEDETPARGKKKKLAADDDDEDSEDEDESEDDDEGSDEEDEEEDEKPTRGKSAKGKKKPAASDDEDEDDDEESESDDDEDEDDAAPTEDAVEALVDLVAEGPVKLSVLEKKLTAALKGNKQAKKIIAVATDVKFLRKQKGWAFDGKVIDAEE